MFGKFKERISRKIGGSKPPNLPTIKVSADEKRDIMAALSPMKKKGDTTAEASCVDVDKAAENKSRLFMARRPRGSFSLDESEVKTGGVGETLRSEKDILLEFDAEYFDSKCDATQKVLDLLTKKLPLKHTRRAANPFKGNISAAKASSGNPFSAKSSGEENSNGSVQMSESNPFASTTKPAGHATLEIETDKQTKVESSGSEPSVVWGKEDTAHTKQSIREMTDNILMDSISEHDRIKDAVNRRLMDEVVANYDKFIKGLQHVNEVDMDLTRASLFVKSARKELLFSKETVVRDSLRLTTKLRRGQRMKRLYEAVKLIKQLSNLENDITDAVEAENFVHAEQLLRNASLTLKGDLAREFTSLSQTRDRLDHIRPWLRRQIDEFLESTIIPHDHEKADDTSSETLLVSNYCKIIKAYQIADEHVEDLERMDINGVHEVSDQATYSFASKFRMRGPLPSSKGIIGMAERIQMYFINGVEKIIRDSVDNSLPGPSLNRSQLPSVSNRSSFSSMETKRKSSTSIDQTNEDDDAYVAACKKMSAKEFVKTLQIILWKLTDLLHTHFLLTQWHRDPFSSLNLDPKYLHRSHRDQDEAALSSASLTPAKHVASTNRTSTRNREEL